MRKNLTFATKGNKSMSKIIVIDGGSLTHSSIFGFEAQYRKKIEYYEKKNDISFLSAKEIVDDLIKKGQLYISQPPYLYFQSLIGVLRRIVVDKDDTVIIARDKTTSWRKIFASYYKAQRKEAKEEHKLIDWTYRYRQIDKLINKIDESTNFHIVWLPHLFNYLDVLPTEEGQKFLNSEEITDFNFEFGVEGDDIMAVVPRVFHDKECIIVTKDCDLDMLAVLSNVKIYTLNIKYRGGTGVYKIIDNGYKVLEGKVRKGDKGDNILIPEDDTEKKKELRKLIIDLINLPEWIYEPIKNILSNLPEKKCNFDLLPFPRSLALRFPNIYKNDKIITYEDSIKRLERKKKSNKKKKLMKKKSSTIRKI